MNEHEATWTEHWDARDLFAFVEQREDLFDPATGDATTAWVLDAIRVDRTQPLLDRRPGARGEIPFRGIAQITFMQPPPCPPLLATATEGSWLRARLGAHEATDATLYRDLDGAETARTKVTVSAVDDADAQGLHALVSLADVTEIEPARVFGRTEPVTEVAVLNVGQGNCNALRGALGTALGYFDLGAGCLWNSATRPGRLQLCSSENPFVVLSHWDFDHWFGATLADATGFRAGTWLAPRQTVGPRTLAFASTLTNLRLWPANRRIVSRGSLSVVKCRGKSKNDSGLAIFVNAQSGWVVSTGDAEWKVVRRPARAQGPYVGLVAPHHGSPRSNALPAPTPAASARVAFSYGSKNTYAHPGATPTTLASAGWVQPLMTPSGSIALGAARRSTPCNGTCSIGTVQP